jgi:transposase
MPKPETTVDPKITPSPTLEKRTRRTFSTEYKLSIIRQADACQHGELGELLRREKLYSNQLSQWRRELDQHGIDGLKKSAPGPAPKTSAEQKRIVQLEKENERLRKQVELQSGCLELQKKALDLLDTFDESES